MSEWLIPVGEPEVDAWIRAERPTVEPELDPPIFADFATGTVVVHTDYQALVIRGVAEGWLQLEPEGTRRELS
jgi:hypothetical protein